MGRGTSKAGGNKGRAGNNGLSIIPVEGGGTIDLGDTPLVYGDLDAAVTGNVRKAIDDWENKRIKNKIEYNMSVDENGDQIGKEVRGGKGSVRVPVAQLQEGATHTHIHPREESGLLGGTFSDGDLDNFATYDVKTYRARAKEGAYSITKQSNFNQKDFKSYVDTLYHNERATLDNSTSGFLRKMRMDNSYTYKDYSNDYNKAFNTFLVSVHNGLLEGQKKYGYSYTLEGGKR